MKQTTIDRVNNWFTEYQWEQDVVAMSDLYLKLIDEENSEILEALEQMDLVETLDWLWDTLWVAMWYTYFSKIIHDFDIIATLDSICNYDWKQTWLWIDLVDDLMNIIADSNYTKVKDMQTEWEKKWKIIKGPNFISPTEWIKSLIEKYNITFITE